VSRQKADATEAPRAMERNIAGRVLPAERRPARELGEEEVILRDGPRALDAVHVEPPLIARDRRHAAPPARRARKEELGRPALAREKVAAARLGRLARAQDVHVAFDDHGALEAAPVPALVPDEALRKLSPGGRRGALDEQVVDDVERRDLDLVVG